MDINKSLSIVIPVYNEETKLGACLRSIAAQSDMPDEVIIVDNNSTDRSVEIARQFPFVTVVQEPRQGRVFARNAGFDAAHGDIIGRIDADARLPVRWVRHVQQFYTAEAHDNQAWSGCGRFVNVRLPRIASWGYAQMAFRLNRLFTGHYMVWGSNMAITRQQWRAVRNRVHMRNDIHEDLDLALHLHEAGFGITFDRDVKTTGYLRRVLKNRDQLWGYLQWWPRTLRVHHKLAWPICWVIGVLGLYLMSYVWVIVDWLARRAGKAPLPN